MNAETSIRVEVEGICGLSKMSINQYTTDTVYLINKR